MIPVVMRDQPVLPADEGRSDASPMNATTTQEAPLMARTTRLNVRGITVTSASQRRFVVVAVRPEDISADDGVYLKFATIEKRSDSLSTARTFVRWMCNRGRGKGVAVVVIDTVTGEEV